MKFSLALFLLVTSGISQAHAETYEQRRYSYADAPHPGPPVRGGRTSAYGLAQPADRYTAIQVQKALAKKGYYGGAADGILGPQSKEAIRHYQRATGMTPTGTVNNSLLTSLHIGTEPAVRHQGRDEERFMTNTQRTKTSVPVQVQTVLAQKGYYAGTVDGVIGYQSQDAIRRYQRSRGLRATGMIDESLLRALRIS